MEILILVGLIHASDFFLLGVVLVIVSLIGGGFNDKVLVVVVA